MFDLASISFHTLFEMPVHPTIPTPAGPESSRQRRTPARSRLGTILCALLLLASVGACSRSDPTQPQNQRPAITSLTASPNAIGPGDSTIVTCMAVDPDGDQMFYDWHTDSRLVIQGNAPAEHDFYDSPDNTHVFYHGAVTAYDSAWVRCIVRDHKGGLVGGLVDVLVNQ